jgi:DNA-binding MarR family transcriptional regulator
VENTTEVGSFQAQRTGQVFFQAIKTWRLLMDGTKKNTQHVAWCLVANTPTNAEGAELGIGVIASQTGLSYRTVTRALDELEAKKYIARRSGQGSLFEFRWLVGVTETRAPARTGTLAPATESCEAQEETARAFTTLQRAFRRAKIHKLRLDNIAPEWPRQPSQRALGAWLLGQAATHGAGLEELAALAAGGYLADDGENLNRAKWPLDWMAQPACLAKLGAHVAKKLRGTPSLPIEDRPTLTACGPACTGCALCRRRAGGGA